MSSTTPSIRGQRSESRRHHVPRARRLPLNVVVVNRQRRRINRAGLERLACAVMTAEGCEPQTELSVVIGDDGWIQDLNRKYRKRNAPTDVLAFPQEPVPGPGPRLLGDVAISAETAARQAKEMGHKLEVELAVLLVHGILHLTGWRDNTPARRRRMMHRVQELLTQARAGPRS